MSQTLLEIRGCLAGLRTDESAARRRSQVSDDSWMYEILPAFLADQIAISGSKAFRRLQGKAQVFVSAASGDNLHVRNRSSHSTEVAEASVVVCGILGLNGDLARAVALGHDLGHTPCGHLGERVLGRLCGLAIRHEVLSVVVAQAVERSGDGLNLTHQTLTGMLRHSRSTDELVLSPDGTAEANVVMFCDKICYTTSDWQDVKRCINPDRPEVRSLEELFREIGVNQRDRVRRMLSALCLESAQAGGISFNKAPERAMLDEARRGMLKVYQLVDMPVEMARIEQAYQIARDLFPTNPVLAVALMTEADVHHLTSGPERGREEQWLKTAAYETLIKLPNPTSISLTDPDLDW